MSKQGNWAGQHRARKRFGQNFLVDEPILDRIAASVAPHTGEHLVEIGPGKGALTARLARACDQLTAIELDRDLIPWLQVGFERHPGFRLFQADALSFDFSQLCQVDQPLRIVGNLPYNISTPLIFHLLGFTGQVKDMHFMLQKEVVRRLAAEPGQKAYGRLSVMVQYHCRVEALFEVPPDAFDPAPKVDSALVRLTPHPSLPVRAENSQILAELVNLAFQQRRKTLRNALKKLIPGAQLDNMPVDAGLRAEALSVADYVALANALEAWDSKPQVSEL